MSTNWYVYKDLQQKGPYTWQEFVAEARAGQFGSHDLVWNKNMEQWLPAADIPGLMGRGSAAGDYVSPSSPAGAILAAPGGDEEYDDFNQSSPSPKGKGLLIFAVIAAAVVFFSLSGVAAWRLFLYDGSDEAGSEPPQEAAQIEGSNETAIEGPPEAVELIPLPGDEATLPPPPGQEQEEEEALMPLGLEMFEWEDFDYRQAAARDLPAEEDEDEEDTTQTAAAQPAESTAQSGAETGSAAGGDTSATTPSGTTGSTTTSSGSTTTSSSGTTSSTTTSSSGTTSSTTTSGSSTTTGQQTITWDGGTYTGPIVDGRPHGQGVLTNPTRHNFVEYRGTFVDGRMTGSGRCTFPGGEVYVGEFVNGKAHGQGTMTHPNGQRVTGRWANGTYMGG